MLGVKKQLGKEIQALIKGYNLGEFCEELRIYPEEDNPNVLCISSDKHRYLCEAILYSVAQAGQCIKVWTIHGINFNTSFSNLSYTGHGFRTNAKNISYCMYVSEIEFIKINLRDSNYTGNYDEISTISVTLK